MDHNMQVVNTHEAKTHLSRLIEQAARGGVVIAKAGKQLAKLTALDAPTGPAIRRRGFMAGQTVVPDDFDRMGAGDIEQAFAGT